jgi:rhomboid family GlyGly-CTERM serine protease
MSVVHHIKQTVVQPAINSRNIRILVLFSSLLLTLQCLQSVIDLSFQHTAIALGDIWRLLTGGLVHANWPHFLLNESAFVLLFLCFPFRYSTRYFFVSTLTLTLTINVCIYIILPQTAYYYGFSGTLYGLFVWLCCTELVMKKNQLIAVITLLYITGKLIHDIWIPDSASSALIHMPVFWPAHCFGIAGGLILFSLEQIKKYLHQAGISHS